MTLVLKQTIRVLAMMMLFVPFAYPQAKDAGSENETLRHAAEKTGFWVGTTIQGRMWNRDPEYKPVLSREFNAAVSIVFQGITQPQRGRFNFDGMDEAMSFAKQHNMKLMGHCLVYKNAVSAPWLNFNNGTCGGWSAKDLDVILRDQIQRVIHHGGDSYYAWEVVNEPTEPAQRLLVAHSGRRSIHGESFPVRA